MKKDNRYVAICLIWLRRFNECSDTCMTSEFTNSVWRFYRSLLNLGPSKLAIKDIVVKYVENTWQPKINVLVENQTLYTNDEDTIQLERRFIEARCIHEVFDFIIQTIQDSGVGWPTKEQVDEYFISQE